MPACGFEDIVLQGTAGVNDPARIVAVTLFSGGGGDSADRAENRTCGEPFVPAVMRHGLPCDRNLLHQMVEHAAAGVQHLFIMLDEIVIAKQGEKHILASPDVPASGLFFRRIRADAAVRCLCGKHVADRVPDYLQEFGVLRSVPCKNCRADDLSPEFAAPEIVFFIPEAERIDQLSVIDFFETVVRGQPERFSHDTVKPDRTGGKRMKTILIHKTSCFWIHVSLTP